METDDIIGSVLKTIEECGIADNTIVIFTSDNGKAPYTGFAELQSLGHYSSGSLRGWKTSVYEGGHRMPFIVRWPGHVKPGSTCNQLIHHTDVMATLSDILGASLPADAGVDSFSFLSLLKGADQSTRQYAVSCAATGVPGFRSGDWKLVLNAKPELYNLAKDIGETKDLAAQEPERVKEMQLQLEKIISEGRSTPGEKQANDVQVIRYPKDESPQKPGRKAKAK
jgi:arylsulfatase A-like enzyme